MKMGMYFGSFSSTQMCSSRVKRGSGTVFNHTFAIFLCECKESFKKDKIPANMFADPELACLPDIF
jgi:hypothetical protein